MGDPGKSVVGPKMNSAWREVSIGYTNKIFCNADHDDPDDLIYHETMTNGDT